MTDKESNSAPSAVQVLISAEFARIENTLFAVEFDLVTGNYSGVAKTTGLAMFKNAWYRIGEGGWREQPLTCEAEDRGAVSDCFGSGRTLRVWYRQESRYEPERFLDITIYDSHPFFVIGWGVFNNKNYCLRVRSAEVLVNGELFYNQAPQHPKVLRGGAGASETFVEDTWQIHAVNSAMLTYQNRLSDNCRHTLVAGGLHYSEFIRRVEFHELVKGGRKAPSDDSPRQRKGSYVSLTVHDPQGKRIEPGELWESSDTLFVDVATSDPFASLEGFGQAMAKANDATPNPYDFITLCGWMTSDDELGDNIPINNSPALVEQMQIANETGLTRYTDVAVRLEPDTYCYNNQGDTQQGWYDDEHWERDGHLKPPYETFAKFAGKVKELGGKVFTYVQGSMPSNDFALAHPGWMLNDDISLLYEHRKHARTPVRYDYTEPGFQEHMTKMWTRLGQDGVIGLKFDYPESAWAKHGGFEDTSYTTVSAYRKMYQMCRAGLGKGGYIHERIMGAQEADVPCTDACVGIVDLQRVWPDSSHFEPEMASRMGLRWYKQGVALRYYPDGKSFFPRGKEASIIHRRTFLTLVGLLSGRIELGTNFGRLTDEIRHDLTRLYPVLPNGQAFRPVDFLLGRKHPEVYAYKVDETWAQVILVNNQVNGPGVPPTRVVKAPVSGDQAETGSLGLPRDRSYHVFDFWAQKYIGVLRGDQHLEACLANGEARVYAVRAVEDHPQILGTNRHIMCGMMELDNVDWSVDEKALAFDASVIGVETMVVTISLPRESALKPQTSEGDGLEVSFETSGNIVRVSANAEENHRGRITLSFAEQAAAATPEL